MELVVVVSVKLYGLTFSNAPLVVNALELKLKPPKLTCFLNVPVLETIKLAILVAFILENSNDAFVILTLSKLDDKEYKFALVCDCTFKLLLDKFVMIALDNVLKVPIKFVLLSVLVYNEFAVTVEPYKLLIVLLLLYNDAAVTEVELRLEFLKLETVVFVSNKSVICAEITFKDPIVL